MGMFDFLGLGGVDTPKLQTKGHQQAIDLLKQYQKPITGLTQAGKTASEQAAQDRLGALDTLNGQLSGMNKTGMANAAMFGMDRGAMERANTNYQQNAGNSIAQNNNMYSKMLSQIKTGNIQDQENLQNTVNTQLLPSMYAGMDDTQNKYNAAKMSAQAAGNQAKSGFFGNLLGAAATAYAGPLGGMATKAALGK